MDAVRWANATLMFVLELAVYAAAVCWAWTTHHPVWQKAIWTVGVLIVLIGAWALWGAPSAPHPATGWSRALLELCWFGSAVLALWACGRPRLAIAMAVLVLANAGARVVLGQVR